MADNNVMAYTANTALQGNDAVYVVDSGTTDSEMRAGDFNLLPDGVLWDGKISVSVAANNLTVALKTRAGNDPSATEPITVYIGGTRRRITAALSVTKNAGTNWSNLGGAELATLEQNLFVYLIWNTTPATDIVDLGFSRIPFGRLYSDFSATTTNEKYLAHANASDPTAGDECVNIGRFSATLSGGAGYTWSVPTFTAANLLNYPSYSTDWLTYSPALTGFSANPTNTVYQYKIHERDCIVRVRQGTNGTSNANTFTVTAPFSAVTLSNGVWHAPVQAVDNGALLATPAIATIASANANISLFKDYSGAVWTTSAGKRAGYFDLRFPIG